VSRTAELAVLAATIFSCDTEVILVQFFIELTGEEKLIFASFRTVP
jgi:hypothetical protein